MLLIIHMHRGCAVAQQPLGTVYKADAELLLNEQGPEPCAIDEEISLNALPTPGPDCRDVPIVLHIDIDHVIDVVLHAPCCRMLGEVVGELQRVHVKCIAKRRLERLITQRLG